MVMAEHYSRIWATIIANASELQKPEVTIVFIGIADLLRALVISSQSVIFDSLRDTTNDVTA